MKSIENTEKRIKNANIVINVETNKKIFNNILQAFKRSKAYESAATQPNIWRIIMKSRIMKFAAVGIMIAVIFLIYNYDGSIDGATIAWAQVEEAVEKVNWMHLIVEEDKIEKLEGVHVGESIQVTWMAFDSEVAISESSNGKIIYRRYIEDKEYLYNPHENVIRISAIPPSDNFAMSSNNPVELFGKLIQMERKKGGRTVTERDGKYNNTNVKIWEVKESHDNGGILAKLFVDKDTILPLAMKMYSTRNGKITSKFKVEFEYPKTGPKDIYEAGAPRSAEIIDNTD